MTDFLILGGGSAGCVLAARLSEHPRHRVTLVEAGRDVTAQTMPPDMRARYPGRAYLDVRNIWTELRARFGAAPGNTPPAGSARRYEQARLLGGGSAINAMMANRGAPSDYDEWCARGAAGWSWQDCVPYFRKLESDRDFGGPLHGRDGPFPVRRARPDQLSPFVAGVMRTLDARGHAIRPDQNGEWIDGTYVGATAISDDGERVPTSVAYLTPEVRRRANVRILTGRQAVRVCFEGSRAVGAVVLPADAGVEERIAADHVILCAGAIHTPALLMRSGVGPAPALAALGIDVVADRAGVGRNLMEHPSIAVSAYLPRSARVRDRAEHHEQAIVRYSSGLQGTPAGDMHGAILSRSGWHSVGERIGSLFFWVNKSYSTGEVTLTAPDPRLEPQVAFNMLSDWRDLERLKGAVLFGAATLADPAMEGLRGPLFPASYSPRVARVAVPGAIPALQRGTLSAMMDLAGPFRQLLIDTVVASGTRLGTLMSDDAALTDFVRRSVGGTWHPAGTCRMGAPDDPLAVCDKNGSVIGIQGLTVCDASLMPTIPRANTNVPTIMIAEKIADTIA